MKAGELVVLVNDVQGVVAGKEGRVMSVREDAVLVECRLEERLHFVLARTWDLLPETIYRRLLKEIGWRYERRPTWAYDRALALYSLFRNLNGEQGN